MHHHPNRPVFDNTDFGRGKGTATYRANIAHGALDYVIDADAPILNPFGRRILPVLDYDIEDDA